MNVRTMVVVIVHGLMFLAVVVWALMFVLVGYEETRCHERAASLSATAHWNGDQCLIDLGEGALHA